MAPGGDVKAMELLFKFALPRAKDGLENAVMVKNSVVIESDRGDPTMALIDEVKAAGAEKELYELTKRLGCMPLRPSGQVK